MTAVSTVANPRPDWVGSAHSQFLAWWLPKFAMAASLFIALPARTVIWVVALVWMGILNARHCGRVHCRYTGPYYLAMIIPVLAFGLLSIGLYGWLALGAVIIVGSKGIWWATERAWGKFQ
jgi:hypothetical protein